MHVVSGKLQLRRCVALVAGHSRRRWNGLVVWSDDLKELTNVVVPLLPYYLCTVSQRQYPFHIRT